MTMIQERRPYDRTSNVLIVDDDDTLLKFFKIHLNKFFSRVFVVENAKLAMDAVKTKEVDLVLTDIRMPKVDGLQLMQKIHKARPDIPILLISGEPMNDEQQKIIELADGFLTKPFSVESLEAFMHFGIDLRVGFQELTTLLKDPKKLRDSLRDSNEASKYFKKEDLNRAIALINTWKNRQAPKNAA